MATVFVKLFAQRRRNSGSLDSEVKSTQQCAEWPIPLDVEVRGLWAENWSVYNGTAFCNEPVRQKGKKKIDTRHHA